MKIPNSPRAGFVLGVAGVAILSPDALLLRLFGGDNFALVAGRGFALAILAGVCFAALPALRRDFVLRPVLIYGALYAAGLAAFPMSVRHTHVANTVVILAVAPLLSAIGAKLFLREHIAARTWAACALSAAGLALVFAPELAKGGGFGDALALIVAFSLAACAIFIRRHPNVNLVPGMAFGGLIVAVIYAPFADWNLVPRDVGILAVNGAVLWLAFMAIIAASRRLSPPEVNLLFLLETALAPLWVWLALGERPPATTAAAGVLIAAVLAWHSAATLRDSARGRFGG